MPARPFVIGGLLLLVLGLVGEFLVFPTMLASNGGEFEAQITTSDEIDTYNEYDAGDTVILVDTIARIQYDDGKTSVWLESIGADFEDDIRFRFDGNLLSDFGPDSKVVITFEVVEYASNEVPEGYDVSESSDRALPADAVAPRYSTQPELAFGGLTALGLLLLVFGGYSAWKGGGKEEAVAPGTRIDDDWGMIAPPVAPAAAPVIAGAAPVAFPPAMAPPATQPAPLATQPTETQLIQCPACQSQLQINDQTRPLNITCPGCQAGMVVR
ncbi:MAG: hypothetical protein QF822_01755 [Candidatus Poseidoniia archaeon]|jgi:hypothetical protein|nr:hypothetical protein [Candidatus Poseidoniia archaeon]MDP6533934.1 hypothetical protein [Candidatus Poseidoniia archaeon]|tara:strand:+ start:364 stop:1173 length:810 start_codon:yes stop_codon:yes gene_type:complete